MKLRIQGNSLRLRVTRSELDKFASSGRIEETIYFAADERSRLTYALERSRDASAMAIRFEPGAIAVILPADSADAWRASDKEGIYATVDLGPRGILEVSVEKDFACLHRDEAGNADSFPNPHSARS